MTQQDISSAHVSPAPPPEIFNIIIANLEADLTPTELKKCYSKIGLIWKEYLPYARSRLFRKVNVGYTYLDETLVQRELTALGWPSGREIPFKRVDTRRITLAKLIMARPSLATNIRHLSYTTAQVLVDQAIGRRTDPCVDILLKLPNIQSLSINTHFYSSSTSYRDGDPMIFGLQRVLDRYLNTGTLTTLSMRSIVDIPILDVLRSRALRSLVMDNCQIVEWTPPLTISASGGAEGRPCFKLRNLSIHNMGQEWCHILPYLTELIRLKCDFPFREKVETVPPPLHAPIPFRKLQVLHYENQLHLPNWTYFVNSLEGDGALLFPALKRLTFHLSRVGKFKWKTMDDLNIMLKNSPSLEAFTLKVNGTNRNAMRGLELDTKIPNCHDLTIEIENAHYYFRDLLDSITQMFRPRQRLHLRTLRLYLRLDEENPIKNSVFASADEGGPWTTFAETLCRNKSRLPYLHRVSIDISILRQPSYQNTCMEVPKITFTSDDVVAFRNSLARFLQQSGSSCPGLELAFDVYYVRERWAEENSDPYQLIRDKD